MENIRTGLVLEGGAMRGMYTAGVLDIFLENNIKMDKIVGVSAGALFGVNYVSGQKGRVIRYNKKYNSDKDYLGLRPLLKEGNIVSTEYAYERVPRKLDPFDEEAYIKSDASFFAVVTNMDNGRAEYIRVDSVFDQMDVLRASGSMPLLSKPVVINGQQYLDGAIADSIPFEWMSKQEVDRVVVILTRDIDYRKKAMNRLMIGKYKKKYPEFARSMSMRHEVYNYQVDLLKKWEKQGRAFVIRPSKPINVSRIEKDPEKLQAVYELGTRDTMQNLQKLIDYMK